jgi:hypothetical protein
MSVTCLKVIAFMTDSNRIWNVGQFLPHYMAQWPGRDADHSAPSSAEVKKQ